MRIQRIQYQNMKTDTYEIWDYHHHLGEIHYKISGKYLLISFIGIFPEYRKKGYAEEVIKRLRKQYPTKYIVGEAVSKSSAFWIKMIKRYDGKRERNTYCKNCKFSFCIPEKKDLKEDEIDELLEKAYSII